MKTLILAALLTGCGMTVKQKGSTEHKVIVQGEAKITHEIKVNLDSIIEACEATPNKAKCLRDLMSALATALESVEGGD